MPNSPPTHQPLPRERDRGRVRQHGTRPSAAKRGYDRLWQKKRLAKLHEEPFCEGKRLRDGRRCWMPATDVDHVIPLSQGGDDSPENLQSMCHSCHSRKTQREQRG
jgi:5-methylcytosine-specific restriction protein A